MMKVKDKKWSFVFCFLFLSTVSSKGRKSCVQSKETIKEVPSCPTTQIDWNLRAEKKKCSQVEQNCTSSTEEFVYHCSINSYGNSTVEVCASPVQIVGHRCVEFNMGGSLIQESPYYNCNYSDGCPFYYTSTEVYKYKSCFNKANFKDKEKFALDSLGDLKDCSSKSKEMIWQIVSFVLMLIILAFIALVIYLFWKNRMYRVARKGNTTEQIGLLEKDKSSGGKSGERTTSFKVKQCVKPGNLSWVSSIDIGDSHCGMAYLDPNNAEDVKAVGKIEKISVLLTREGELKYFGDHAREMYISGKEEVKHLKFVNELKMDKKKIQVEECEYEPIKIYTEVIKYLLGKIRAEINKKQQGRESPDICYVFTVPKHWAELIEDLRNEILQAQIASRNRITKEKLHIKFRRVAIAPYIHEVRAAVLCLNFNVDNLSFKQKSTYGLLHIGSTYCSLLFLQVGDFKMPDEILGKPYKKEWKLAPQDKFVQIFEDVFTPSVVEEWKQTRHREYIALLDKFEKYKTRMYENTEESEQFEFTLSKNLEEIYKRIYESQSGDIEESVKKKVGVELKIVNGKYNFAIAWHLLKSCFQDVVNEPCAVVEEHKDVFTKKKVNCVIMTGIYPKMKYLQKEAEKKWFYGQQVTVAIPVDTGSIFAIGAAYYMNRYPSWAEYEHKYDI